LLKVSRREERIDGKEFIRFVGDGQLNAMLDPDAIRLAEELDGLPLALATAEAYLNQTAPSSSPSPIQSYCR
jgi:hypothetical protein